MLKESQLKNVNHKFYPYLNLRTKTKMYRALADVLLPLEVRHVAGRGHRGKLSLLAVAAVVHFEVLRFVASVAVWKQFVFW